MTDLNGELLTLLATAGQGRKMAALQLLRGDAELADATDDTMATEPFLTLREIGRRIGVSPCSLWRWGVPGHELGGRRRFRLSEVEAYLESNDFKRRAAELRTERRVAADAADEEAEEKARANGIASN